MPVDPVQDGSGNNYDYVNGPPANRFDLNGQFPDGILRQHGTPATPAGSTIAPRHSMHICVDTIVRLDLPVCTKALRVLAKEVCDFTIRSILAKMGAQAGAPWHQIGVGTNSGLLRAPTGSAPHGSAEASTDGVASLCVKRPQLIRRPNQK
jgi:hypothetical protein